MTQTEFLVLGRTAGFVARAPGFSHPSTPVVARIGVAFALAIGISPGVSAAHAFEPMPFLIAMAGEFLVGTIIGIGTTLLYDAAYTAGRMLDDYVGIRGSVPTANVTAAQGFGRLWSYLFLAGFFLLDGYAYVILTLADSFSHIHPGAFVTRADLLAFATAFPVTIVRASVTFAAPAIAVVAVVQLALGAVARVIPRFSSFTLAFPIVFAVTIIITLVTLPLAFPLSADPRPWLVMPWVR